MASSLLHYLIIFFFSFFSLIFISQSAANIRPKQFVLPVQKDSATGLHVANIHKRTPLTQVPLLVDVNGQHLWVTCDQQYLSSTYQAPLCHSTLCSKANSHTCHTCPSKPRPGCHNNTCELIAVNPVTRLTAAGELAQDVISIQSSEGSRTGPTLSIPQFLFACAPSSLLQRGLPKKVQGVIGFGHRPISLPPQIAAYCGFPLVFALCLTSSTNNNGVIFLGMDPYVMQSGIDIAQGIGHTPLIIGPKGEYYIQVTSININGKPVPLNKSLLSLNKNGVGGTMISTTSPYTVLETSIYKAVIQFFANQIPNVRQVTPVAPFGVCYNSKSFSSTPLGPGVPNIGLVLHDQNVVWRIVGANSMVQARPGVLCLAFVDGGLNPKASIVIGAYQLEDNLLQFNEARSSLGFSSSLLHRKTTCANYKFTPTTWERE